MLETNLRYGPTYWRNGTLPESQSMADVQGSIRALFLEGPAGRLEGLLNQGLPGATHSGLVCHPHPLFGGTMHNKVAFHAMKALNALGLPVLRFNFRGAGLSEGEHDHGQGEVEDVIFALNWLDKEFGVPVIFAGFSFGASVGLRACCPDARVPALISLGTPIRAEGRSYGYGFLKQCAKPKLFVSGDGDPFGPKEDLAALVHDLPEPKELVLIPGAGHFFENRLGEMRQALDRWLREFLRRQE
ncbi:MAG TPA: alpha/beta family hydrolase [Terriglobales bacterium]|nr:alpha/beta family hydrolase [Terriglobales bacterium]